MIPQKFKFPMLHYVDKIDTTNGETKQKWQKMYNDILNTSSLVHIYFKELGIVKYQKDQLYGPLDVIGKDSFLCSKSIFFWATNY